MYVHLIDKDNNHYVVKQSDIRRVCVSNKQTTILFVSPKDNPIKMAESVETVFNIYLRGTNHIFLIGKNRQSYVIKKSDIKRVHVDHIGRTVIVLTGNRNTPIVAIESVEDFFTIFLK